ncbi:MAG: hypothetical protein ACPHQT_09130 [Planctomycetota bacterium]
MKSHSGKQKAAWGILFAAILFLGTLSGCSFTRKTTIDTDGDQEVQRTSYSFEFHGLTGDDSDDD